MAKSIKPKGSIRDGILYKTPTQAVKFWAKDGYGIRVADLHNVEGVILDTKYDGKLYAPTWLIEQEGEEHMFGDEKQLILKTEKWRVVS